MDIARIIKRLDEAKALNDKLQSQTGRGCPTWRAHETIDDKLFDARAAAEELEPTRRLTEKTKSTISEEVRRHPEIKQEYKVLLKMGVSGHFKSIDEARERLVRDMEIFLNGLFDH